jgi:hypothetical protein
MRFPTEEDISTANVMCPDCGVVIKLPVHDSVTSGTCANGHLVANTITRGLVLSKSFISETQRVADVFCEHCGSQMRVVKGHRGKFWDVPTIPNASSLRGTGLRRDSE